MSELCDMSPRAAAASRRTTTMGRGASPVRRGASASRPMRAGSKRASRKAPVELRPLRLAALVLLLVAAALYVSPLRAFFAAQDRYFSQVAAVAELRAANHVLRTQIADMHNAAYVIRQARKQFQLVPAGLQAFVVKGLPHSASRPAPTSAAAAGPLHPSLRLRLSDLWHTLLH